MCQQIYAIFVIKELGLDHSNTSTNKTYIVVHKTNNQVISGQAAFLKNKFNLEVNGESKKLPNIYWTSKLHKNPLKARLLTAAPQCSVKPLSRAFTWVLKLMYNQIETYNSKMHYFSEIKLF